MPLNKPIDEIVEADLQDLIADREAESQIIDYKRGVSLDSDKPRDEFRADVSSFANASGGHLILGMEESRGFPSNLCGMDIPNPDALKLRLDDVLQTKIAARIPGVGIRPIALANGNTAVVIRVPKSFAKPHQITVNKDDFQFWSRNSAGKYRLSVDELRSIILQSDTLTQQVRNFRLERLGNIVADETPLPLLSGAKTVLHMIPMSAFDAWTRYDLTALENANRNLVAPIVERDGFIYTQPRYNLDGYLTAFVQQDTKRAWSYLQVYRNGVVEGVEAMSLNLTRRGMENSWKVYDELLLASAVTRWLALQKFLGVEPPIVVIVTLLGVAGHTINVGQRYLLQNAQTFDRDTLLLPDILVDTYDMPIDEILRPIFDAIWNAGGHARCFNYDAEGKRMSPP